MTGSGRVWRDRSTGAAAAVAMVLGVTAMAVTVVVISPRTGPAGVLSTGAEAGPFDRDPADAGVEPSPCGIHVAVAVRHPASLATWTGGFA